jgi:hypothetical protein
MMARHCSSSGDETVSARIRSSCQASEETLSWMKLPLKGIASKASHRGRRGARNAAHTLFQHLPGTPPKTRVPGVQDVGVGPG